MRQRSARPAHTARTVPALAAVVAAALALTGCQSGEPGAGRGGGHGKDTKAGPAGTVPQADFDGDGHADLASAASTGVVHGTAGAGYLTVTYGSDGPAGSGRHRQINQDDDNVPGGPEKTPFGRSETRFGEEAVARDFDGDGYTDLATNADFGADYYRSGGDVIILWGSAEGLSGGTRLKDVSGGKRIRPGFLGEDATEAGLTGGDFDGDGHADLVLGLGSKKGLLKGPFSRKGTAAGVGAVPAPDLPGGKDREPMETRDTIAGDMNGDGADDLLTLHSDADAAASNVIAGGPHGFAKPDASRTPGASAGVIGDVDNDGYGDVVLGRHSAIDGAGADGGRIEVIPGSKKGPDPARRKVIDQDTPGVPGKPQRDGDFGSALDAGDVNGDGYADVVVGAPGTRVGGKDGSGSVTLLKGGRHGLGARGAQVLHRARGLAPRMHVDGDFGASVRLLDMNGDNRSELAAGAPSENSFRGVTWILRTTGDGPDGGLTEKGARALVPADFGASSAGGPQFGGTLAR